MANAAGSALLATMLGKVDPLNPKVAMRTTPLKQMMELRLLDYGTRGSVQRPTHLYHRQ